MVVGGAVTPDSTAPQVSSGTQQVIHRIERTYALRESSGWVSTMQGGSMEILPETINDLWIQVDSTGLISRLHVVVSDPDGRVVQEAFYRAGGDLITKTIWDTDAPIYPPTDVGEAPKVKLDWSQDAASVISDPRWKEVTDTLGSGNRVFQQVYPPNEISSLERLAIQEFDSETGAFARSTVSEVGTGLVLDQVTVVVLELIDLSATDANIWEPVLD